MKIRSKAFALLTTVLIIISLVSLLSGCGSTEKNSEAKLLTEKFIDAIIDNDPDAAYSLMTAGVSRSDFDTFFVQLRNMFDGINTYELKQTGWNASINNGVSSYKATFEMKADNGAKIQVETSLIEGYENIAHIYFTPIKVSSSDLPMLLPFKLGALLLSAAVLGFTVWMIVDCAKRNVYKKALWIILILVGISVSLSIGNGFHINWLVGLAIGGSSVKASAGVVTFKLMVPIGAIVYFAMRKKLTKTEKAPTETIDVVNIDDSQKNN